MNFQEKDDIENQNFTVMKSNISTDGCYRKLVTGNEIYIVGILETSGEIELQEIYIIKKCKKHILELQKNVEKYKFLH